MAVDRLVAPRQCGQMRHFLFIAVCFWGASSQADALGEVLLQDGYVAIKMSDLPTGHRTVTVMLNGQLGQFIVDSGASQTVVDAGAAELYPFRASATGTNVVAAIGPLQAEAREASGYQVGPVAGGAITLVVADLAAILAAVEAAGGGAIDGVLGQDILDRHAAIIDLPRNRLFLKP